MKLIDYSWKYIHATMYRTVMLVLAVTSIFTASFIFAVEASADIPFERLKSQPGSVISPEKFADSLEYVTCEGQNLSGEVLGTKEPPHDRAALILCPSPFGQWLRSQGGREYRGVRTRRYTYVRDLNGPWLLYDNRTDPFQQQNLINKLAYRQLQGKLESHLQELLDNTGDRFLSGPELIRRCGYKVDKSGTVDYNAPASHGQISVSCRDFDLKAGEHRFKIKC